MWTPMRGDGIPVTVACVESSGCLEIFELFEMLLLLLQMFLYGLWYFSVVESKELLKGEPSGKGGPSGHCWCAGRNSLSCWEVML